MAYPKSIQTLIDIFSKLPTIGPKTAERIVLFLISKSPNDLEEFSKSLIDVSRKISQCSLCGNYSDTSPCDICSNASRDHSLICAVAKPQDIQAIEKTHNFTGLYHILGGTVNPIEGVRLEQLNTKKLIDRITNNKIKEIILAFNPDLDGETTILALKKLLEPYKIKITRLARGLPMGSDIEYADEVTLSDALKGRKDI